MLDRLDQDPPNNTESAIFVGFIHSYRGKVLYFISCVPSLIFVHTSHIFSALKTEYGFSTRCFEENYKTTFHFLHRFLFVCFVFGQVGIKPWTLLDEGPCSALSGLLVQSHRNDDSDFKIILLVVERSPSLAW